MVVRVPQDYWPGQPLGIILENDPDTAGEHRVAAAPKTIYCNIMSDISSLLAEARLRAGLSQRELARRAGTSQSAIARLEAGAASPTLATLERLLTSAGFALRAELVPVRSGDPVVDSYKRDVDRGMLRENLRLTVEARLLRLQAAGRSVEELRAATRAATRRSS
jgi:transcriptional regulator with XRE-family HTH domain